MIDFYKGEIKDIMPFNLISPETKAISFAVGQAMKKLQEFSRASHIYGELSKVPESVLDLLALELNTQYYDQTMPRKLKEQLITQTTAWYMHAGTPGVLEEFLDTALDGGEIQEWFQYGGKPYYFKALVQVGEHEIPLGYGLEVKRQIELYKNARSWLEHVAFVIKSKANCEIDLENAVRFRGKLYPRLNTPYLKLDGFWKLDGKRLSGYDSDEKIDFYPVKQKWELQVPENVLLKEQWHTIFSVLVNIDTEKRMRFSGRVVSMAGIEHAMHLKAEVREYVSSSVRVTSVNRLSSEWKLNGNRTLNSGLSVL
jgi:P2-related tail formation protein